MIEEGSGSVVESLTRDQGACEFEPHWRHCVVSSKMTLSTGSTQEELDVKNKNKQTPGSTLLAKTKVNSLVHG